MFSHYHDNGTGNLICICSCLFKSYYFHINYVCFHIFSKEEYFLQHLLSKQSIVLIHFAVGILKKETLFFILETILHIMIFLPQALLSAF